MEEVKARSQSRWYGLLRPICVGSGGRVVRWPTSVRTRSLVQTIVQIVVNMGIWLMTARRSHLQSFESLSFKLPVPLTTFWSWCLAVRATVRLDMVRLMGRLIDQHVIIGPVSRLACFLFPMLGLQVC